MGTEWVDFRVSSQLSPFAFLGNTHQSINLGQVVHV